MIELENVSLDYGNGPVLQDISLCLVEHRIGIVGANGSGKSSFARLLNGLRVPSRGRVLVDGIDTARDGRAARRRVGFVFQNPDNQIVFPIVEEDIAFGLKSLGLSPVEKAQRITQMLARYGLEDLREATTHHLSGGQKQLLAIAGVLAMEPAHVVFDEPTTLLDLRNKLRVARAIDALTQPALVVTHDLDLLRDFDRVLVFEHGRLMADDTPGPALRRYIEAMQDA